MPRKFRETPIERMFREVMGRAMPSAVKSVLLNDETSSCPNLLDYPGGMCQWEKESLVAEARLARDRKKKKRLPPTRRKPRRDFIAPFLRRYLGRLKLSVQKDTQGRRGQKSRCHQRREHAAATTHRGAFNSLLCVAIVSIPAPQFELSQIQYCSDRRIADRVELDMIVQVVPGRSVRNDPRSGSAL
jgi:hypothetical protein